MARVHEGMQFFFEIATFQGAKVRKLTIGVFKITSFNYYLDSVTCGVFMQLVSVFLSAFTLLAISVDRYRAVIFPLQPRPTIRTALLVIAVTWTTAMIASLPVAMFARVTRRAGHDGTGEDYCEETWPRGESQRYAYSISVMVLQYFLPLAILTFTYINIAVVVWAKRVPGEAVNSRDQKVAASKRKVRTDTPVHSK